LRLFTVYERPVGSGRIFRFHRPTAPPRAAIFLAVSSESERAM
jgi:hypothetical protein